MKSVTKPVAAKARAAADFKACRFVAGGRVRMRRYQWGTREHRRPHGGISRFARTRLAGTRLAGTAAAFGILMAASGCLEIDKPELAIDIPQSYRAAHGAPEAATPALDWWRSFKSRELTSLVEQAVTANLDIAVAIAQIVQADAQVRIAGAPCAAR